jgi:YidC/Oxa1 family membrane protein insertase
MSTAVDRNQRMIMMALPFVFVPFIQSFPAGLIVYWITTNFWTVGQQYVIRRTAGLPVRGAPAPVPAGAAAATAAEPAPIPERRSKAKAKATANGRDGEAPTPRRASAPPPPPRQRRKKKTGRRR